jgi:hypothetical protein
MRFHGMFNPGFFALRRAAAARAMLRWWQETMLKHCGVDLFTHMYVDQTWLDTVPALFSGVHVEHGPGYNVAYWNLLQRPVTRSAAGQFEAGGEPLVFFHFSGFEPDNPACVSAWMASFDPVFDEASREGLAALLAVHAARLRDCGLPTYSRLPYGYATLRDGTLIRPVWREMICADFSPLADIADPFDTTGTPDLVRRFEEAEREFEWPAHDAGARLRQLESLYQLLDGSPLLGPLLRRYKLVRAAKPV